MPGKTRKKRPREHWPRVNVTSKMHSQWLTLFSPKSMVPLSMSHGFDKFWETPSNDSRLPRFRRKNLCPIRNPRQSSLTYQSLLASLLLGGTARQTPRESQNSCSVSETYLVGVALANAVSAARERNIANTSATTIPALTNSSITALSKLS